MANSLKDAIDFEEFEQVGALTFSFGLAILEENETCEELLKRSDEKLYEAKETGRNRVAY